jgi:circadian clock protein KaiC
LRQLIEGLEREMLTAILSHEVGTFSGIVETLEVSEFLADTVILLKRGQRERGIYRTLEIMKSRGQDFDSGQHTMRITNGKGLEVFRRVQSRVRDEATQPTSMTQRSASGAAPIDALLGGGLYEGSVTMVVGVSGVGKTILGTQMLVEGARTLGKRGLMVTLDEHPAQIQRNATVLGLGLDEQVRAGMIQILFDSPLELEIDAHVDLIIRTIEQNEIDRLVVDGLTTYSNAIGDQRVFREFLHGLIAFTKNRLMTTFLNYENPELFGVSRLMAESGVSSIVDNIILLSFVELGNQVHRGVTVVKARGSDHRFVTREYSIGQGGIILAPPGEQALPVLPFQSYHGLLSRAPTRVPYGDKRREDADAVEKP